MNNRLILVIALGIAALITGVLFFTRDKSPDKPKIATVGLLIPTDSAALFLQNDLAELGYVEGETIQYLTVVASDPQEYESAVQSLIDKKVDVIVCTDVHSTLTASKLTTTIPIVFTTNQDQFSTDIEPLMKRQGETTNLTGIITINPAEKRFELMMEIAPTIKVVYVPYDPNNPVSNKSLSLIEAAAVGYGVKLETYEFSDDAGVQQAMEEMPEGVDAIFLGDEIPSLARLPQWADHSIESHVPLIVPLGLFNAGYFPPKVLMGYGEGIEELYQNGAELIDQILQGTAPGDLPVRPSDVYLTVSLGAADAFGISISDSIMDQTSQVIREEVLPPATALETQVASEGGAACNAVIATLIGENTICITSTCDLVQDSNIATFSNKIAVANCSTANVVGICSTASSDTYFYNGDVALLKAGCTANDGEWKTSVE